MAAIGTLTTHVILMRAARAAPRAPSLLFADAAARY